MNLTIRAAIERLEHEIIELRFRHSNDLATIREAEACVEKRQPLIDSRCRTVTALKDMLKCYGDQEVPLLFDQEIK